MQLVCIPPQQAKQAWDLVQPMIAAAVMRCGDWTLPEIWEGLQQKTLLLWVALDRRGVAAAAITKLVDDSGIGRTCWVIACGGSAKGEWPGLLAGLEDFARDEGCARIRLSGRKGWSRVLKDYRQPFITLEKAL